MLEHAIASGRSVCLSVYLSVGHTRDLRLHGSRYRITCHTKR